MDKRDMFKQVIIALEKNLAEAKSARDRAQQEANSHVGAMESRYDTWKEENQYEVAAQELRIREYESGIGQIEYVLSSDAMLAASAKVRVGSIVVLLSDVGEQKSYLLSPAGGGVTAKSAGTPVFVLTTESPLGKQLIGLEVGEECTLQIGGQKKNYEIKEVH